MRKKNLLLMGVLSMTLALTGCTGSFNVDVSGDKPSSSVIIYYTEDEVKNMDTSQLEKVQMDGKTYYKYEQKQDVDYSANKELNITQINYPVLNKGIFYSNVNSSQEFDTQGTVVYNVKLDGEVSSTNGKADDTDKTKVVFEVNSNDKNLFAYSNSGKQIIDNDHEKPVVTGIKDGATYSEIPNFKIKDNVGVKSVYLNGGLCMGSMTSNNKILKILDANNKPLNKQGANVLTIEDLNNNKTIINFTIGTESKNNSNNTVAPNKPSNSNSSNNQNSSTNNQNTNSIKKAKKHKIVVSNIKNGKKYKKGKSFYVKANEKIKSIKINNKKVKLKKCKKGYKCTLKKKGKNKIIIKSVHKTLKISVYIK